MRRGVRGCSGCTGRRGVGGGRRVALWVAVGAVGLTTAPAAAVWIDVDILFDRPVAFVGETVTVTVVASGQISTPQLNYFSSVNADFFASDPGIGLASPMENLGWSQPVFGGNGGQASGASLLGVLGAQLQLFGPVDDSNPFVVGNFEVQLLEAGVLSYTVPQNTDRRSQMSWYDPSLFSCPVIPCDQIYVSSQVLTVRAVPTPGGLAVLGLGGLAVRRRRSVGC